MALDKNALLSLVATNKPNNTGADITPAKSREVDEQSITSAANLAELTEQTFLGPIHFQGGVTGAFNATTDIIIDRVLEAVSLATSQDPTGLGIANSIQVEFGAAQFTVNEPVMIDVDGMVTFNVTGMYRVKSVFQFGRTGASGTSELLFRLLVSGAQLGRSVGVKLGNADDLSYIDIDNWFNVPAGTTLTTEIMRDNSGNNSGGIFKTSPTDEGAGTWSDVPCTVLRIERWASP